MKTIAKLVVLTCFTSQLNATVVEVPRVTNVTSVVTVGEILGGRHIQRVELFGRDAHEMVYMRPKEQWEETAKYIHTEIAHMLLLIASPQAASVEPHEALAFENDMPHLPPSIRVRLTDGHDEQDVIIRRLDDGCYRFYWDGKTAWFRFAMPSNQTVRGSRLNAVSGSTMRRNSDSILPIVIALVCSIALLAGGIVRLFRKQHNGWTFLLTGLTASGWALLKIVEKGFHDALRPEMLTYIGHYATLLAGAGIVLGGLLVLQEVKARKAERKSP